MELGLRYLRIAGQAAETGISAGRRTRRLLLGDTGTYWEPIATYKVEGHYLGDGDRTGSKTAGSKSLVPCLASYDPVAESIGHPPGKAPNHKAETKGGRFETQRTAQ